MAGNSVGGGQIIPESHAHDHHCLTKVIGVLVSFSIRIPVMRYDTGIPIFI